MLSTVDEVTIRKICILVGIERIRLNTLSNRQIPSHIEKKISHYIDELLGNPSRLDELWARYQKSMCAHWGKREFWSLVEAALVSIEIDPREVMNLQKSLKRHVVPCLMDNFKAKIVNEYLDRMDLIVSKFRIVEVEHPPIEYLEWFESKEIEFPQACALNIRKYHPAMDYKKLFEAEQLESHNLKEERNRYREEADKAKKSKSAQSKETDNLKIMNYLLAKKAFPNLLNDRDYTSKIVDYLSRQGFDISNETVRKQFIAGKTFFKNKAVKD